MECAKSIQAWQDGIICSRTFSPSGDLEDEDEVVGSPKAAGYNGWKPIWDRRWVDTSSFSSNDWAYYHNTCDLTGEDGASRLC